MIVAELKDLSSTDVSCLQSYRPDGPFGIVVFAMVGPAGGEGAESFQITVCTSEWFAQNAKTKVASGRHHLFMREYDYDELKQYLVNYCSACRGSSWEDVAEKVARIGYWEFEDYRLKSESPQN